MKYFSVRIFHFLIAALVLAVYFIETGWDNLFAVAFLFLCMMSPIALNVLVALFAKARSSQIVLLCTTVAYSAWATVLYLDVSNSTDGQAGLALLATTMVALPALIPAWVACLIIEFKKRQRDRNRKHKPIVST